MILKQWMAHYNRGRPHASLGPGIPDVAANTLAPLNGHQIPVGRKALATSIWGSCLTNITGRSWRRVQ